MNCWTLAYILSAIDVKKWQLVQVVMLQSAGAGKLEPAYFYEVIAYSVLIAKMPGNGLNNKCFEQFRAGQSKSRSMKLKFAQNKDTSHALGQSTQLL